MGQDYGSPELLFVIIQSSRVESGIRKRRERLAEADSTHHLVGEGSKNPTIQVSLLEIQNSAHLPEGHPSGPSVPKDGRLGHRLCLSLL